MGAERRARRAAPAVALMLALGACAPSPSPSPSLAAWAGHVDQVLSAAERERAAGHLVAASAVLETVTTDPCPEPRAPLAVALRENAAFALGRVLYEAGHPAKALAAADWGLSLREDPTSATVFTASLHALRALALEALSRPDDAIGAWEAAQIVHSRLFERALAAPDQETPR